MLLAAMLLTCCSSDSEVKAEISQTSSNMTQLYITIGGVTKTATMVSNSSTEALVAQLLKGDITYEAHDYGSFEKVGALGYTFPENNTQITTEPGDLILYQGSNLCIYYDTNSWNFTRIGKLDNMTQADIKQWVNAGGGNVTVTLSLDDVTADMLSAKADAYYDSSDAMMSIPAVEAFMADVTAAGGTVQLDTEEGWSHPTTCEQCYTDERLDWLFSQVRGAETGIREIGSVSKPSPIIYDVSGRPQSHPASGIYIKEGKKYI